MDAKTLEDCFEGSGHLFRFVRRYGVDSGEKGAENEEDDVAGSKWKVEGKMKEDDGEENEADKPSVV